jgi:hypothetical protein
MSEAHVRVKNTREPKAHLGQKPIDIPQQSVVFISRRCRFYNKCNAEPDLTTVSLLR